MKNNQVPAVGRPLDASIRVGSIAIERTWHGGSPIGWPQEHITGLYSRDPLFIGRTADGWALALPAAFNAAGDHAINNGLFTDVDRFNRNAGALSICFFSTGLFGNTATGNHCDARTDLPLHKTAR